jgi:hypothetical protein
MGALLRIVLALLSMASRAAAFGPAHELLPSKVRLTSFGFVSVCVAFFGAALFRHAGVAGFEVAQMLTGHAMYFAFLLLVGRRYAAELTLYMAASTGVDLSIAALGVLGLDVTAGSVRHPALAWEFLAAGVAIIRLHLARRSAGAV